MKERVGLVKIAIMVVAFSAIMGAITQPVLAMGNISKTPSDLTLGTSETGTFTVTVVPDHNITDGGLISVYIEPDAADFDIVIEDNEGNMLASGNGGRTVADNSITYYSGTQKTFYVYVTNNGVEGEYGIEFLARDGTTKRTSASIWAEITAIPEFAMLAMPMMIALGIALFFLRRK